MSEKNLTGIGVFLEKLEPEMFDVKDLMREYYECYADKHEKDEAYKDMLGKLLDMEKKECLSVEKWFLYKTLDEGYGGCRFDCDSSNDTCWLTTQVYNALWLSEKADRNLQIPLGGDTMNSFAAILNVYEKTSSFKECYKQYKADDKVKNAIEKVFGDYAKATGCIGNFVLVPNGFNRKRYGLFKDFWDRSLQYLKQQASENVWLSKSRVFERYINYFFLWDYVACDEKKSEYFVKSLLLDEFRNSNEYNSSYMVSDRGMPTDKETPIFLKNARWAIKRRGIFMTAMLRLQADKENEGAEKYAEIREKIFSASASYSGYGGVFEAIESIEGYKDWPENIRTILTDAQKDIENVERQKTSRDIE